MTPEARTAGSRLDPDDLAHQEEERDFLLRSLADLEREHDAGDLDEADYEALRDDYTTRAARVLRAIDAHELAIAEQRPQRSGGRVLAVSAAVVAFAVLAGFLVAQSSGRRGDTDTATGDIRLTSRQELADAQQLLASGDTKKAIAAFEKVIAANPSSAEALAYRGWAVVFPALRGATSEASAAKAYREGMTWVDRAIEADPQYPDARAFKVILLSKLGRTDEVAAAVDAFQATDPPPQMEQLLAMADLPVDPVDRCVSLIESTDVRGAIDCLQAVLADDPENAEAMAFQGWVLTLTAMEADRLGSEGVDTKGLYTESLDWYTKSLGIDPTQSYALAFRIVALDRLGRTTETDEAIDAFLAIDPTDAMVTQLETYVPGLRSRGRGEND